MIKCSGCGIEMQYIDKEGLGYTENEDNTLCERCFRLKHYGEYKKVPFTNKDYQSIIRSIPKDSYVLYLTDILSLDIQKLDISDKIKLVVTKIDLLPKSINREKIKKYIKDNYSFIKDVYLISNKNKEGIVEVWNDIKNEPSKKIYFIGATNSGKSSLINEFIKMSEKFNNMVTVSMYPSTTLGKVEIKLKDITLIDTPGLISENHMTNVLSDVDIKRITPKKTIKPKSCQLIGTGSIAIDNYVRIDYQTTKKNSIVIYASNALNIRFISEKNTYLQEYSYYDYSLSKSDVVIPGIGFIKCTHDIKLRIYVIGNVSPYIRNNLI